MGRSFKKTVALLAAALLALGGFAAFADDRQPLIASREMPRLLLVQGSITEINDSSVRIQNQIETADYQDIILNIHDGTAVIEAVSGDPMTVNGLKVGEYVYAYVSPAMTRSAPPIANAEAVIANIPADFAAPSYLEVQDVAVSEDGTLRVTSEDNRLTLILNADTPVSAYLTKNVLTLKDVKPGVKLFAWSQVMTLSEPPQASPYKLMLMPYGYSGYLTVENGAVALNGQALDLAEKPYAERGVTMLPLRAIAEACGYEVGWNAETATATMSRDGEEVYQVTINSDMATLAGETITLGASTVLKEGKTYIAANTLELCQNLKLVLR